MKSFVLLVEMSKAWMAIITQILDAMNSPTIKPSIIICHTTKGKGVSFMENEVVWHYKSPNKQELELIE